MQQIDKTLLSSELLCLSAGRQSAADRCHVLMFNLESNSHLVLQGFPSRHSKSAWVSQENARLLSGRAFDIGKLLWTCTGVCSGGPWRQHVKGFARREANLQLATTPPVNAASLVGIKVIWWRQNQTKQLMIDASFSTKARITVILI